MSASIEIAAAPEAVYAVLADVERTPEWSTTCQRVEWIDGSACAQGAVYRGHNRQGPVRWKRDCRITESRPGQVLAFDTLGGGQPQTSWRYELEPAGSGTRVTESYRVLSRPWYVVAVEKLAPARAEASGRANLEASLAKLKAVVEGS